MRVQCDRGALYGAVRVERYRWVVERIEESPEVLYARLLDMWEMCANFHHWEPLEATALRLTGRELPSERMGVRRPGKDGK